MPGLVPMPAVLHYGTCAVIPALLPSSPHRGWALTSKTAEIPQLVGPAANVFTPQAGT